MSCGILLKAVATHLQTEIAVDDSFIDVMPDNRPKIQCGEWFASVYGGEITSGSLDGSRYESYKIEVSLTVRTSPTPKHSKRLHYVDNLISLDVLSSKIIDTLHNDYALITAAQALLDASVILSGAYTQVLKFESQDPSPNLVGPDFFHSDIDENNYKSDAGINSVLSFGTVNFNKAV